MSEIRSSGFIWNNAGIFRKVYAFEPGKRQYNAMQVRINRLAEEWGIDRDRFVCINGGLGEEDAVVPFAQNIAAPTGSSFITCDDSGEQVNIYSLDSFLNQAEVTMIKADIEGFELEMLRGARNIIQKIQAQACHKRVSQTPGPCTGSLDIFPLWFLDIKWL